MQEMVNALMIEVFTEEGISPEQLFFYFNVVFIIMAIQEKKSKQEC